MYNFIHWLLSCNNCLLEKCLPTWPGSLLTDWIHIIMLLWTSSIGIVDHSEAVLETFHINEGSKPSKKFLWLGSPATDCGVRTQDQLVYVIFNNVAIYCYSTWNILSFTVVKEVTSYPQKGQRRTICPRFTLRSENWSTICTWITLRQSVSPSHIVSTITWTMFTLA